MAISDYVNGAQRSLQAGWPDLNSVREAIERVSTQIARGADGMRLLREAWPIPCAMPGDRRSRRSFAYVYRLAMEGSATRL